MPLGAGEQGADPEAAGALGGEAPGLVDLVTLAHLDGDLAQGREPRGGQHQVVPAGTGLDDLDQVIEGGPGPGAAGRPEVGPEPVVVVILVEGLTFEGLAGGGADRTGAEIELGDQRQALTIDPVGHGAKGLLPERELLVAAQGWDFERQAGVWQPRCAGRRRHQERGSRGCDEAFQDAKLPGLGQVVVLAVEQQSAPHQGRLPGP